MMPDRIWITVRDGTRLAADLYMPPPGAARCPALLEALPYRKDDLTSMSHTEDYVRLSGEGGFVVCRLDVRGTGTSAGRATDEYPPSELDDLADVIAWLADQPWCNGKVGMFGYSYSGFNSLQMACERPPALAAICAVYATDDRYTDDVHYAGGALKAIDQIDYCGATGGSTSGGPASTSTSRGSSAGSTSSATARTGATGRSVRGTSGSCARR
jgi:putative CocE/NonD family hydrolase